MPIHLNCSEDDDSTTAITFEIAFNFQRDTISLPERFVNVLAGLVWQRFQMPVEQYRLQRLNSLLDDDTLQKINNVRIGVYLPPSMHGLMPYLRAKISWRGEGLDVVARGGLKRITLFTTSLFCVRPLTEMVEKKLGVIWGVDQRGETTIVWRVDSDDDSEWVLDPGNNIVTRIG
jgi:hypothetical protein